MLMAFKKKPDFDKLTKVIINKRVTKLELLASEIIVGLINRTQRGKDVSLRDFKKYTKEYAQQKKKKFGGGRPNLTRSSSMLNSITSKRIKNGLKIRFDSSHEAKKAKGNMKTRKFFGLDRKQKAWIKKKLSKL